MTKPDIYRFSPILDEERFGLALEHVATELGALSLKLFGERPEISVLKLFAHYPDEYDYLRELVSAHGDPAVEVCTDKNFYVHSDLVVAGNYVKLLGVRTPDPYRMQVGCGDFEVPDFGAYRKAHLNPDNPYVRDAKDSTDMLEFWHPDTDVLGYIIPSLDQ